MTIRLLSTYRQFKPNTNVTLASGTETALVAGGNATTDLSGGVPYDYQLPANTMQGNVAYAPDGIPLGIADSTGKIIQPFTGIAAPGAPTGLALTAIAGGVLATMTAPASTGGTGLIGYEVTLSTGQVQLGETTTITINAPAGVAVTATAKAINGFGKSVASTASASVTPTAFVTPARPGAPTGLTLAAGNGKVTATWTAAASNGSAIRDTIVTLSNGATGVALGSATTVDITTPNGLAVTATARANNGEGAGPVSGVSNSVTPVFAVLPGQPAKPVLTALAGAVSLAWTPGAANGTTITGNVWTDINGNTTALTTNPQVIAAPAGTPYTGTVKTQNSAGFGPPSAQADAVTPANPVLRPSTIENRIGTALAGNSGMRDYGFECTAVCAVDEPAMCLRFDNFIMQPGGTQDNPNAVQINTLEIYDTASNKSYTVTFPTSGTSVLNMASGATRGYSNVVTAAMLGLPNVNGVPMFKAGTVYNIKGTAEVPTAGGNVPLMDRNGFSNAGMKYTWWDRAVTTVSNTTGVGPLVFTGGSPSTKGTGMCPIIYGYNANAWCIIGDSITKGVGDVSRTDSVVGGGEMQRACQDGVRLIANVDIACTNATTIAYNGVNGAKARTFFDGCVNGWIASGTNDFTATGTGVTAAADLVNNQQLAQKMRDAGISYIVRQDLHPRADSSSDGFTTEANQVINAAWTSGAPQTARANYAAATGQGLTFDAFAVTPSIRGTINEKAWTVVGGANCQADGTHPVAIGHLKTSIELRPYLYARP